MEFELNFKKYEGEGISIKNIYKHISDHDIFNHYYGPYTIGKITSSPFRIDDHPSFGIYVSRYTGKLMFNDFMLGSGNSIQFVKMKYRCSYQQALSIINEDFNLGYNSESIPDNIRNCSKPFYGRVNAKAKFKTRKPPTIKIRERNWMIKDKEYWKDKYNISSSTLNYFKVSPITFFQIDSQIIYGDSLCYAYYFKDGIYKIYQPNKTNSTFKWYTNVNPTIPWQGYNQLPNTDDILFITSSLKDVMVLYECGYSAIAPHSENGIFTQRMYAELKERFLYIVIYYDNDEAGVKHSTTITNTFKDLLYINNPKQCNAKDPSDYVNDYSLDELKELIKTKLKEKIDEEWI